MELTTKQKYLSAAGLLLVATAAVKVIGAVYKIPLTGLIGGTGRGYFSTAYTLFMPVHAITLGAFPIALSGLVSIVLPVTVHGWRPYSAVPAGCSFGSVLPARQ